MLSGHINLNYLYGEIQKSEAVKVIDILDINKNSTVIDIGSGNSRFLCSLIRKSNCNAIGVECQEDRHIEALARRSNKNLEHKLELKNKFYPCKLDNEFTHAIVHCCTWNKENILKVFNAIPQGVKIIHNSTVFNNEFPLIKQEKTFLKTSYTKNSARFWYFTK